jgi:hypothetical protein
MAGHVESMMIPQKIYLRISPHGKAWRAAFDASAFLLLVESKEELGGQCLSPQTPRHLYKASMKASF